MKLIQNNTLKVNLLNIKQRHDECEITLNDILTKNVELISIGWF